MMEDKRQKILAKIEELKRDPKKNKNALKFMFSAIYEDADIEKTLKRSYEDADIEKTLKRSQRQTYGRGGSRSPSFGKWSEEI